MPEGHIRCRIDDGKEGGDDESCCEVREKGEGCEVLYRAAEFAGDDRSSGRCRHNETKHKTLCENMIGGKGNQDIIDGKAEDELDSEDDPMPAMKAEVKGIDLAEGEKEHKENQPREDGFEWQEPSITQSADEHREPKDVRIKLTFDD